MKFLEFLKNVFANLAHRLKPRPTFRWIFSFVVWLVIILYLVFGIYFGLTIYKYKTNKIIKFQNSTSIGETSPSQIDLTKISSYLYPFPAVMVNGKIVWASEYFKQLNYIERYSAKTKDASYLSADTRTKIIDMLVENEIIEFQALKYNLRVNNKDFNVAYAAIVEKAGGKSNMKKVLLDLYGMSEREFKTLVRQQVLKERILNELMLQVKVSHIYMKDENRAKEVMDKLNKGEKFADLAKTYSEDVKSRDNGGDLGWLARGQLVADNAPLPEFDNAVFAAKIGDLVGPIKTSAGFEIVKIDGKKGTVDKNFNVWLSELKAKSKVWRFIK